MKKFVSVLLLAVACMQASFAHAAVSDDELRLQLTAVQQYLDLQSTATVALSDEVLRKSIQDGVQWVLAAQEENGHFKYEYAPFENEFLRGDNMVRQAGTLFMLSEVYRRQAVKDTQIATTIERAASFLDGRSMFVRQGNKKFSCIKNSEQSSRCDLGTTALAVLGLINYVTAAPEQEAFYGKSIAAYIQFLLSAKFTERGFSDMYRSGVGFSVHESPFYNGEALLALVRYYHYSPTQSVKETIDDSFNYLRTLEYEPPLYLWIMAALKDMQQLWPSPAYVAYAKDFTSVRLQSAVVRHGMPNNYCAPLEGMVSAYSVLRGNVSDEYHVRLLTEINYWLKRSVYLQIDSASPYRVVIIDTGVPQLKRVANTAIAHGGFLTAENVLTQRIDFTQHCVSAFLQKLVDIDGGSL